MSLENEDYSSTDRATEASGKMLRRSRMSYTRECLLSLSELEVCKRLPSGFDESILSEFADASPSFQDRQRIHGSAPLQGLRHTEYGSSPPTRGEIGNNSRGAYGRWDSRSSGPNDRDLDSQSDKDSDSGRRYGSQSRKTLQGPEHDGLLGSGSFPRPSGYGGGTSAQKNRPNDRYQLNRSNEPYHPPRPFKAAPLSRSGPNDSHNDETFGSTEITDEDRAEEEKRRRASFEVMRMEQKKAMQEKHKSSLNKDTADSVSGLFGLLNDSRQEKHIADRDRESEMTGPESTANNELGKSTLPSQTTYRPLVPPGFTNFVVEKDSGLKSLSRSDSAEVRKKEAEECIVHTLVQNGKRAPDASSSSVIVGDQLSVDQQLLLSFSSKGEKGANFTMNLDSCRKTCGVEDDTNQGSLSSEAHELLDKSGVVELNPNLSGLSLDGEFNHKILGEILGSALSVNASNSMDTIKVRDDKVEETPTPKASRSSKFARWFVEEETKATNEISSSSPNDLLSLLVGGNKEKMNGSDNIAVEHVNREFSPRGSEDSNKSMRNLSSVPIGVSESVPNSVKQEVVQSVLTCEDLEQTILSECTENRSTIWPFTEVGGAKTELSKSPTDDHASLHLLSLLQKGATQEDSAPTIHLDRNALEKAPDSDVIGLGGALHESLEEETKSVQPPGKNLTLETLFGSAFMQELQSVEAPVSVQRGSVGSPRDAVGQQALSSSVRGNGGFPSVADQLRLEKTSNANTFLLSNHGQKMQLDTTEKWMGYDDPIFDLNLSREPGVMSKTGGYDGAVNLQLPEEENLISSVNDELNPQFSKFSSGRNLNHIESLVSSAPGDIKLAKQLAAIGAVMKDDRPTIGVDGSPFVRDPYKQLGHDNLYRDLHAQTTTTPLQSMHMNQGKHLLQQLDPHSTHVNSHMKFAGAASMTQHDVPANQQFRPSMLRPSFHHANVGVTGFDRATHHPMLHEMQMQGRGDYPPHLVNDFQRVMPVPHQATGFRHEPSPLQGYPFGRGPPNFGGQGIPVPGPDVNDGTHHPEAFQRLVEMELRANAKRRPPFPVGHGQGMYGNELDLLRYR